MSIGDPGSAEMARRVLLALADMTPSGPEQQGLSGSVPTEWFRWLPLDAVRLFTVPVPATLAASRPPTAPSVNPFGSVTLDKPYAQRLAAIDQIRPDQRSLRAGWLFMAGPFEGEDGKTRRILHPLVTVPVRVSNPLGLGLPRLVPAGDVEISPFVGDPGLRLSLTERVPLGGGAFDGAAVAAASPELLGRLTDLQGFARRAADAARFPFTQLVPAFGSPSALMASQDPVVVAGVAVFPIEEVGGVGRAPSLRAWADRRVHTWTAFHSLYTPELLPPEAPGPDDERLESPYLLTPNQRAAVRSSRTRRVTVVSGAPGTGKSQTVVALACDAVARGESVLVAAKSEASVDALVDLFERAPGPDPVVFGSNERRDALAQKLAQGQVSPVLAERVASAELQFAEAVRRREQVLAAIVRRLRTEAILDGSSVEPARFAAITPDLFAGADLGRAVALLDDTDDVDGFFARRRSRKAAEELRELVGADEATSMATIAEAVEVARLVRDGPVTVLDGRDMDLVDPLWDTLVELQDVAARRCGDWMAADSRSEARLNTLTLPTVSALATALRSGRGTRRTQLERIGGEHLTEALPLWVGTLADVEDLLPPAPALFDVVVLDEAASIEQSLAAPALRGGRAVVVGDPRQLRHTSFLSGEAITAALAANDVDLASVLAVRLDCRRNSTFDVAAGVAPVINLGEHFRSAPPLMEAVADELYGGSLLLATRTPATEAAPCLVDERVGGARGGDGVVEAEVAAVIGVLRRLLGEQRHSVAVVSPFRAQVEAIEARVLDELTLREIGALDLRVGTVHGMQGNERDTVVISLGVEDGASGNRWRFVLGEHLLAVLLTRARTRTVVVRSTDPPADSLLARFLASAASPDPPPRRPDGRPGWAGDIATDLVTAGLAVQAPYPVGRHELDLCLGGGDGFLGVVAGVHADGPHAHVERHTSLRRSGWRLAEAMPGTGGDRRGEVVIELARLAASYGIGPDGRS